MSLERAKRARKGLGGVYGWGHRRVLGGVQMGMSLGSTRGGGLFLVSLNMHPYSALEVMFPPPPARSQYSVLIRVGVGVRVMVGLKDSVGVHSGQKFPWGAFCGRGLFKLVPFYYWLDNPGGRGGSTS